MPYSLLADVVLHVHLAVVIFVVGGLVLVPTGHRLGWRWVHSLGFRLLHLGAIAVIAIQAWLGQYCPLTLLESWLRVQAGQAPYAASFIEHWVHRVLYFQAPLWVFAGLYTGFGLLVVLVWWRFPPRRGGWWLSRGPQASTLPPGAAARSTDCPREACGRAATSGR